MALTSAQIVDTRRFMGYSVSGDATAFPYRELAYSAVSYLGLSIEYRLSHMTADEEDRLVNFYLANLTLREGEIQAAADNLDTNVAAVWTRNRNEIGDRRDLFTNLRLELCQYLGFPPGKNLAVQNRIARA